MRFVFISIDFQDLALFWGGVCEKIFESTTSRFKKWSFNPHSCINNHCRNSIFYGWTPYLLCLSNDYLPLLFTLVCLLYIVCFNSLFFRCARHFFCLQIEKCLDIRILFYFTYLVEIKWRINLIGWISIYWRWRWHDTFFKIAGYPLLSYWTF